MQINWKASLCKEYNLIAKIGQWTNSSANKAEQYSKTNYIKYQVSDCVICEPCMITQNKRQKSRWESLFESVLSLLNFW